MQDIVAWLIALEALSWLGFPVAHLLMGRLADRGWAVARILALLLLAWVTWIGGSVGIVPNSPVGILAVLSVFVLGSVWLAHRQRSELRDFFRRRWTVVLTVELTFLAMFAFWALVISEVPAINHTEKPMDFGILNAIVGAGSFPPMDSWLAGHGIAYYYGGHYVAATLTTLTGVPTDIAYNLSIATVAALAATGVLGLVYNLVRFSGSRVSPALVVGLIAAGGVLLLGNLSGLLEFAHVRGIGGEGFWGWAGIKGLTAPTGVEGWFPDQFWWWWRGSRVIDTLAETGVSLDYTITEVPFFSFLLGDLHAHVTVLPFLLLVLTLALSMMVSPNPPGLDWIRRQPWEAAAVCLAVGALAFMNAWDYPVYLAIIGMAALLRWFSWFTPIDDSSASDSSPPGNRLAKSAGRAGLLTLGIAAAGVVLFQPFYWSFDSQAQGILPVVGPATRPFHFLVVMGVPALLAAGLIIRALMEVGWPTRQQRSVAIAVAGFSIAPLLLWLVAVGIRLSVNPEDIQPGRRRGFATIGAGVAVAGNWGHRRILRVSLIGGQATNSLDRIHPGPGRRRFLPVGGGRVVPHRRPVREQNEHRFQGLLPGVAVAGDGGRCGHLLHYRNPGASWMGAKLDRAVAWIRIGVDHSGGVPTVGVLLLSCGRRPGTHWLGHERERLVVEYPGRAGLSASFRA